MRRLAATTDLILLATVAVWALNVSVTKYVLTHGFAPLAYASIRYALAALLAALFVLVLERSLAVHGRHAWLLVSIAALFLFVNQICFVYSLKLASATTVSLILGTTPIFAALFASAVGLERLSARFWLATLASFAGVALVALGSGGGLSSTSAASCSPWACRRPWCVLGAPDRPWTKRQRHELRGRPATTVLLLLTSIGALGDQDYGTLPALDWLALGYAVVGPLLLTNVLWFTAIRRVGRCARRCSGTCSRFWPSSSPCCCSRRAWARSRSSAAS